MVFPCFAAEIPIISGPRLYVHNHWKTPPALNATPRGAFHGVGSTQVLEVLPDLRLDLSQAQWLDLWGNLMLLCMVLSQIKVLCFFVAVTLLFEMNIF